MNGLCQRKSIISSSPFSLLHIYGDSVFIGVEGGNEGDISQKGMHNP